MTTDKSPTRPAPRVTHAELQAELARLRAAIALLANHVGAPLSPQVVRALNDLLTDPADREPPC